MHQGMQIELEALRRATNIRHLYGKDAELFVSERIRLTDLAGDELEAAIWDFVAAILQESDPMLEDDARDATPPARR